MSKESALKLATGNPAAIANPSLISANPPATVKAAEPVVPAAGASAIDTAPATTTTMDKDNKLAIFIKKEAEIFKAREQVKKDQLELVAKQKEYDDVISKAKLYNETFSKDKVAALKLLGWSETDIVNLMAEKTAVDPVEEARRIVAEETAKIRSEFTEKEKKAAIERDAALVSNFKNDLAETLKKDASKYKFAAHRGKEAELQAMAIIEQNLIATEGKELISIEEALQITDDLYKADYAAAPKIDEPAPAAEPTTTAEVQRGSMAGRPPISNVPVKTKTLTNAITATAASARLSVNESRAEKRERLMNVIKTHGLRKT